MSESQVSQRSGLRIQLIDLAAIVVGYGLAAILFRAFWPHAGVPPALGIFAVVFYIWLGIAMSGPLLLLRHRPTALESPAKDRQSGPPASRTWAEMAWLVIGVYWITLGVFVLPVRLHRFRFGDAILFGAVPLLAGLVLYLFGPDASAQGGEAAWTHRVAVWLLLTWPIAWLCLIAIAESML
ncbi:MAG: hypothetical protein ACLP7Q_20120 [Isosphaeraceae bacterium]